jgi:hypothetical protein
MAKPIVIKILGDASGFSKAADTVSTKIGGMGSAVGSFAKVGAVAFAGLGIGALAAAPSILEAGNAFVAMENKANTVFEDSIGGVKKWAHENAKAMGLTTHEATNLAASFGDLLKPMGFSAEEASKMSTDVVGLSGALSAWSGGQKSAAEVSEILAKAMLGERDGLKSLGISITEADVQSRLAAKGQDKLTGAALEQAKAIATQELVFEKSTDAQKAWADGSMDAIKSQNELKATLTKVKEVVIMALLPVLQKGVEFLSDKVLPVVQEVIGAFDEGGLAGVFQYLKTKIVDAWPQIQAALAGMLQSIITWVGNMIPPLLQKLGEWGNALISWIGPQIPPLLQKLGEFVGTAANWLLDEGLPMMVEKLVEFGNAFVDWVGPQIPPLLVELTKLLIVIGEWILTSAVPKLLELAIKLAWALTGWAWDLSIDLIKGIGASLLEVGKKVPGWALDFAKWGIDMGTSLVTKVIHWWYVEMPMKLAEKVSEIGSKMAGFGRDLGKSLLNGLIEIWNKADLTFPRVEVPGWVPGMGGKGFGGFDIFPDAPTIRAMGGPASGLVRLGERGPETVVLPNGSRVIPNHATSPGGDINVYVTNPQADAHTVGREVGWAIRTSGR